MAGTDGRPQGGARGWCGRSSVVAPPQPYLWQLGPSRHRSGYRYRVCDKSMHWQDNAAHASSLSALHLLMNLRMGGQDKFSTSVILFYSTLQLSCI